MARDDLELMGLDYRLLHEQLMLWRDLPPEDIGISVKGDGHIPILLSLWLIESSAGNGERRVAIQSIAVQRNGTRMPGAERQPTRYFSARPAMPMIAPAQRNKFFQDAVEPTLQRELKHKGAANGDESYSATLIGCIEVE